MKKEHLNLIKEYKQEKSIKEAAKRLDEALADLEYDEDIHQCDCWECQKNKENFGKIWDSEKQQWLEFKIWEYST